MSEYTNFANPIGTRLKIEMKKRGYTSTELARRANVLTSFLYDIISGKSSNPSTVKLARVAEALEVSLTYLVSGTDGDYSSSPQLESAQNYITIPHVVSGNSANGEQGILAHLTENEPFYFNSEWVRNHLTKSTSNLRIIKINGDSMEPALFNGDIVLVDSEQRIPSPPSIFGIFDGSGICCKRLEYCSGSTNSRVRVISDNKNYSSYECSISDLTIIGRVVWLSRKV